MQDWKIDAQPVRNDTGESAHPAQHFVLSTRDMARIGVREPAGAAARSREGMTLVARRSRRRRRLQRATHDPADDHRLAIRRDHHLHGVAARIEAVRVVGESDRRADLHQL